MKTRLSLAAVLATAAIAGAAGADTTLMSVNFANFTQGNLANDATGTTAGQGGWYVYTTGTGGAANVQVVADPAAGGSGNVLRVTNGTTATGNNATRFAWTDDIHNNIGNRGPGENLIVGTYDFFVGAATTSTSRNGAYFYDASGTKILAGVTFQQSTGQFYLVGNYNNAGTIGNYSFSTGTGGVLANRNTWYKFAVTFDITTGRFQGGFSTDGGANFTMFYVDGAAAGTVIDELDLISSVNSATAAQGTAYGYYNNINVYSTPAPGALALLGVAGLVGGRRRRA